jgi:hypothetical protein
MKFLEPPGCFAGFVLLCSLLAAFTACRKVQAPGEDSVSAGPIPEDLQWNLKMLVKPYAKAGFANRKWDKPAKLALTDFARVRSHILITKEPWAQIIATNCDLAVRAGCKDHMGLCGVHAMGQQGPLGPAGCSRGHQALSRQVKAGRLLETPGGAAGHPGSLRPLSGAQS